MHTLKERGKVSNLYYKPKASRRKKIIKIRVEIKNRKTIEKNQLSTELAFEKISKIDKPLARLTQKKRNVEDTNYQYQEQNRGYHYSHCR